MNFAILASDTEIISVFRLDRSFDCLMVISAFAVGALDIRVPYIPLGMDKTVHIVCQADAGIITDDIITRMHLGSQYHIPCIMDLHSLSKLRTVSLWVSLLTT